MCYLGLPGITGLPCVTLGYSLLTCLPRVTLGYPVYPVLSLVIRCYPLLPYVILGYPYLALVTPNEFSKYGNDEIPSVSESCYT